MKVHNLDQKRRGVIMLMAFIMTFLLVECAVINREGSQDHHEEHSRQKRGLFDLGLNSVLQPANVVEGAGQFIEKSLDGLGGFRKNTPNQWARTDMVSRGASYTGGSGFDQGSRGDIDIRDHINQPSGYEEVGGFGDQSLGYGGSNYVPEGSGLSNGNYGQEVFSQMGMNSGFGYDPETHSIQNQFSELFGQGSDYGSLDGLLKGISGKIGVLGKNHDHFSDNHRSKELIGVVKNKLSVLMKLKKQYGKDFLNSHFKECNQLLTEINSNCDLILNPQIGHHEAASFSGNHLAGGTFGQGFLNLDIYDQFNVMKNKFLELVGPKLPNRHIQNLLSKTSEKLYQLHHLKGHKLKHRLLRRKIEHLMEKISKILASHERHGGGYLNLDSAEFENMLMDINTNCDSLLNQNIVHPARIPFGGQYSANGGFGQGFLSLGPVNPFNWIQNQFSGLFPHGSSYGHHGTLINGLLGKIDTICKRRDYFLNVGYNSNILTMIVNKISQLLAMKHRYGHNYLNTHSHECDQILTEINANCDLLLNHNAGPHGGILSGGIQSVVGGFGSSLQKLGIHERLNLIKNKFSGLMGSKLHSGSHHGLISKILSKFNRLCNHKGLKLDGHHDKEIDILAGTINKLMTLQQQHGNDYLESQPECTQLLNDVDVNLDNMLNEYENFNQNPIITPENLDRDIQVEKNEDTNESAEIDPRILDDIFGKSPYSQSAGNQEHYNSDQKLERESDQTVKKIDDDVSKVEKRNGKPVTQVRSSSLMSDDSTVNGNKENEAFESVRVAGMKSGKNIRDEDHLGSNSEYRENTDIVKGNSEVRNGINNQHSEQSDNRGKELSFNKNEDQLVSSSNNALTSNKDSEKQKSSGVHLEGVKRLAHDSDRKNGFEEKLISKRFAEIGPEGKDNSLDNGNDVSNYERKRESSTKITNRSYNMSSSNDRDSDVDGLKEPIPVVGHKEVDDNYTFENKDRPSSTKKSSSYSSSLVVDDAESDNSDDDERTKPSSVKFRSIRHGASSSNGQDGMNQRAEDSKQLVPTIGSKEINNGDASKEKEVTTETFETDIIQNKEDVEEKSHNVDDDGHYKHSSIESKSSSYSTLLPNDRNLEVTGPNQVDSTMDKKEVNDDSLLKNKNKVVNKSTRTSYRSSSDDDNLKSHDSLLDKEHVERSSDDNDQESITKKNGVVSKTIKTVTTQNEENTEEDDNDDVDDGEQGKHTRMKTKNRSYRTFSSGNQDSEKTEMTDSKELVPVMGYKNMNDGSMSQENKVTTKTSETKIVENSREGDDSDDDEQTKLSNIESRRSYGKSSLNDQHSEAQGLDEPVPVIGNKKEDDGGASHKNKVIIETSESHVVQNKQNIGNSNSSDGNKLTKNSSKKSSSSSQFSSNNEEVVNSGIKAVNQLIPILGHKQVNGGDVREDSDQVSSETRTSSNSRSLSVDNSKNSDSDYEDKSLGELGGDQNQKSSMKQRKVISKIIKNTSESYNDDDEQTKQLNIPSRSSSSNKFSSDQDYQGSKDLGHEEVNGDAFENNETVTKISKTVTVKNARKSGKDDDVDDNENVKRLNIKSRSNSHSDSSLNDQHLGVQDLDEMGPTGDNEEVDDDSVSSYNKNQLISKSSMSSDSSDVSKHSSISKKKTNKVSLKVKSLKGSENYGKETGDFISTRHVEEHDQEDKEEQQQNDLGPSLAELEDIVEISKTKELGPQQKSLIKSLPPDFLKDLMSLKKSLN